MNRSSTFFFYFFLLKINLLLLVQADVYSHCLSQSLNYTFYHSCHQQVKSLTSSDLLLAIRRQANSSCLSETNICCQVYVPNRNTDLLLSIRRQANSSCLSDTNICCQVYDALNRNPDRLLAIRRQANFSCLSDTNLLSFYPNQTYCKNLCCPTIIESCC